LRAELGAARGGFEVELLTSKRGKISIVSFSGRVTLGEVEDKIKNCFQGLLDAGERLFVFNMAAVPYVDSAGVGELVSCAKWAYEGGGVIKIVLPPDSVTHKIFLKTGLDKVFELYDDEDAALASLSV
jgi:anti-sigma B factor antagonist